MVKYIFVLSFFIVANFAPTYGQKSKVNNLLSWQDSLKKLSYQISQSQLEPERYNANYTFIKTLVNALKTAYSFNFGFDSLKTIAITRSPDSKFRLFTWHVLNDDGSYRYYGAIQLNSTDGKLELLPLVDYTPGIKNATDTITTNDKWYGAQYYKIIPVRENGSKVFYMLLGWKGNTVKSTKKLIEILSFEKEKAYFGKPVFDGSPDYVSKKRIIFEYNSKTAMMLRYLNDQNLIIFDHLAPMNEKVIGKSEFYGPDLTYDGFRLVDGRCRFLSNLPLKNAPSDKDEQFIDPKKKHLNK